MGARPLGVMLLVIVGALVTIGQFATALRLVDLLPFVDSESGRSLSHWIGAVLYVLIGLINTWILGQVWNLRPGARQRVIVSTVVNGVLALLAMLSPATFWQSLPAIAINVAFFYYFRSEGARRTFGEA